MSATDLRECLQCGLLSSVTVLDFRDAAAGQVCPKCDEELFSQTDGTVLTRDIAHNRETVERAVSKMDSILQQAWQGYARAVRLVVGGGVIRNEVLGQLQYYVDQGWIIEFSPESPNQGAVLVRLR